MHPVMPMATAGMKTESFILILSQVRKPEAGRQSMMIW